MPVRRVERQSEEPRPYHETIVEEINASSDEELESLARLVKKTKLENNHDAVIAAWNARMTAMCWRGEDLGVPASVLEQKEKLAKKSDGGKHGSDRDQQSVGA